MEGRGCWDPDCPSGGKGLALLVMRDTTWGALSSAGKRIALKDIIASIAIGLFTR